MSIIGIRAVSLLLATCLVTLAERRAEAQDKLSDGSILSDKLPDGAPTVACEVPIVRDASKLLTVAGTEPVTYVFGCGAHSLWGKCQAITAKLGSANLPRETRFTSIGQEQNGWTCVQSDTGMWFPSDRLVTLPPTPAITTAEWLGWWHQSNRRVGSRDNRILITRSKTSAKVLHVSGRAYWYGMLSNVHSGEFDSDASAYGDTLHIVDGDKNDACVVDLIYQPLTRTFSASDNMDCGGMNVRFRGEWQRFTPDTAKPH